MKFCYNCKETKPKSKFHKHSSTKDGVQVYCAECANNYKKQWRKENKISVADSRLKSRYKINTQTKENMIQKQDNKCEICENELISKYTVIDHCHKTGNVRGILCGSCNTMLGFSKDSIKNLKSAQKYLEKYAEKSD
jgi:hypothetical protein